MTMGIHTRPRGPHGYVVIPAAAIQATPCPPPVDEHGHVVVTRAWAIGCFLPSYRRAFVIWGSNARAIAHEIVGELLPQMRMPPTTGAEIELTRRIELAVAVLQNEAGFPTPFPAPLALPRPHLPEGAPWQRALLTGWAR